jgi:glutaredoxin
MDIGFEEETQPTGMVPQIYVDDKHIGGYQELLVWAVDYEHDVAS